MCGIKWRLMLLVLPALCVCGSTNGTSPPRPPIPASPRLPTGTTTLSALGFDPMVTAVAYDSGGMTNAARVWFILQYYGLNAVILNGGWPALASATGLPSAAPPSAGGFRAVSGSGSVGLVDRETLRVSARRSRACVRYADARGVHRRGRA